jgi:cytochrome d ubiquinol oxidase subunit II
VLRRVWLLRVAAGIAVTAVVAAWGLAQYPYLLPGTLTLAQGSAPVTSLQAELVVMVLAAFLVVPSFAYLYWLQPHGRLEVTEASGGLRRAVANDAATTPAPVAPTRHPVVATVVVGAAVLELAREAAHWGRHRLK